MLIDLPNQRNIVLVDRVYGTTLIEDPCVIQLIKAPQFQRLRRVSQGGIPEEWYSRESFLGIGNYFTRFDHSLGVWALLMRHSHSRKEQIAGLLHDASHKAGSHFYDWVKGKGLVPGHKEDEQDLAHLEYLERGELGLILRGHGFIPEEIANIKRFPLLEQPSPDLCADRIDYAFREMNCHDASAISEQLTVINGQWVCTSIAAANTLVRAFLTMQRMYWGSYESVSRYQAYADAMRILLNEGSLTWDDFEKDDDHLAKIVKCSKHPKVRRIVTYLERTYLPAPRRGDKVCKVYKKFRHIDPLVMVESGAIEKFSVVEPAYLRALERFGAEAHQGIEIRRLN